MDIKKEIVKINTNPYLYGQNTKTEKLELVLRKLSHYYYNTSKVLVSDDVFDTLKEALEKRDPNNSFLSEVGVLISKEKVKLPYWMGSLDKIKPSTDSLNKWLEDYHGSYVLSDKLDGVSALLIKDKEKLSMYTRGNGLYGQNISHLIPFLFSKKMINSNKIKDGMAIRGELIIKKDKFKKSLADEYANSRNTVSGLVNSKNFSTKVASFTSFVAYNIINPPMKQSNQLSTLEKMDFEVVNNQLVDKISNEYLSELLLKRRKEGEYEIDGIVVADDHIHEHSAGNPRSAFAFKTVLTDQMAETKVVDVIWGISMDARLVPRIEVEPVELVGTTITYATAHNAKYIVDNVIGPGAMVKLIRSGDVIPYIMGVTKEASLGKPKMPEQEYVWSETEVDLYLKYPDQYDEVIVGKLTHFFSTIGVKYINVGVVTKLVEAGYKTPIAILTGDKDNMSKIEGLGKKIIDRFFLEWGKAIKKIKLYQLMAASRCFGRGLGVKKLRLITTAFPHIMVNKWKKKELFEYVNELRGYDTLSAKNFADNFENFKKFHRELSKVTDLLSMTTDVKKTGNKLKGEVIVFSGIRDKVLEEFIESEGGSIGGLISSKTTLLVYTDTNTSKYKKAIEKGIKTIPYSDFVSLYSEKKQEKLSKSGKVKSKVVPN